MSEIDFTSPYRASEKWKIFKTLNKRHNSDGNRPDKSDNIFNQLNDNVIDILTLKGLVTRSIIGHSNFCKSVHSILVVVIIKSKTPVYERFKH